MKTGNTTAPSYHLTVSLDWVIEFGIISSCLGKVRVVSMNLKKAILGDVHNLHKNSRDELYVLLTGPITSCCSTLLYQNNSFTVVLGHSSFSVLQQFVSRLARIR